MFNIRARRQDRDLAAMNSALGDVTDGVFFDFADRRSGSAQVNAGVFGPRGVALASYRITECQAVLPGAATHIKFEKPVAGVISQRHGDTDMFADPATSILSGPGDCEMNWLPEVSAMHSLSMSLPVRVLEDFLASGEHPLWLGNSHVVFDGALGTRDAQFVDLLSYILGHFERIASNPMQGDLAEALLLETFIDLAHSVGFLCDQETAGLRPHSKRSNGNARLISSAKEHIRAHAHEPLTMPQVATTLGVSLRKLQLAFKDQCGITPRMYLAKVRLESARENLLRPDLHGNVTSVAFDCGFVHLGRFSRAYFEAFGEYPSNTLERSQTWR